MRELLRSISIPWVLLYIVLAVHMPLNVFGVVFYAIAIYMVGKWINQQVTRINLTTK